MPDKSCRTCGGELVKWSCCTECRKITQRICRSCNLKTVEHLHQHHVPIILQPILEIENTHAVIYDYDVSYKQKPRKRINNGNLSKILVICGIVLGTFVLGMAGVIYSKSSNAYESNDSLVTISTDVSMIPSSTEKTSWANTDNSNNVKFTHKNCLGVANGIDLTVTCPIEYGGIYKIVVKIPSELIHQFDNAVFSLRGISVVDHGDSISIQYGKQIYKSKFLLG